MKASADLLRAGEHASTFGGNPFACRAGLTVIQEIERRELLTHVEAMATRLREQLEALVARHPTRLGALAALAVLLSGLGVRRLRGRGR